MDKEQLKYKVLSKTKKTSSCWFYTGMKASGYGTITVDGKRHVAHRIMYRADIGEIPEGKELDHLCGIKHCVNPEHLEAVSHLENARRGPQYKDGNQNHLQPHRKKTHLLYIHNDKFRLEEHKSALVNKLLEAHYNSIGTKSVDKPQDTAIPKIPGVQLGAKGLENCSGKHFMSRRDCGKPGCIFA